MLDTPYLPHYRTQIILIPYLYFCTIHIFIYYYYSIISCSNPNLLCFSSLTGSSTPLTILLVLLLDFISFTVTFERQDHQICTQNLRCRSTLEKWGVLFSVPFLRIPMIYLSFLSVTKHSTSVLQEIPTIDARSLSWVVITVLEFTTAYTYIFCAETHTKHTAAGNVSWQTHNAKKTKCPGKKKKKICHTRSK